MSTSKCGCPGIAGIESFYIRALGVYLLDLYKGRSDIVGGVERCFIVTYTKNGEEKTGIFSIS